MSIKEARGYTQVFKSTSFRQGLPESRTQGCESTKFRVARLVASFGIAIHGFWIPAIPAGTTNRCVSQALVYDDEV
jgi:hypothetical protein